LPPQPKRVMCSSDGLGASTQQPPRAKVDVTAPTEVTAVFLKEDKEGQQGPAGLSGATGSAGATGPNGSNGAAGGQGPAGPVGPAGAQGPAGPVGKVELVTCKTVKKGKKKVQKCTTKLVSGIVKFTTSGASARATLSRHGVVFASGTAVTTNRGQLSLRLTSLRKLRAGRYTLTLISGAGSHETIRSEAFTLN
jgi:hypothetical protein